MKKNEHFLEKNENFWGRKSKNQFWGKCHFENFHHQKVNFFRTWQRFFFRKTFFGCEKKYIFSELRKKNWYSFDVKNYDLSIYDVFTTF